MNYDNAYQKRLQQYKLDIVTLPSYNSSFRSTFNSSTSNTSVAPPAHTTGKGGTLQTDQAYIIISLFSTAFFSAEDWEASSVNLLSLRVMFVTVSTAEVLKKDNPWERETIPILRSGWGVGCVCVWGGGFVYS